MARVRLIHWNAEEAEVLAETIAAAGHRVDRRLPEGQALLRALEREPGDVVVISLDRIPSQGRDLALWLRKRASTRRVPLVLAGGTASKVASVKKLLPDAVFTSWRRIAGAIDEAVDRPPSDPVVPSSTMAGYSGTPLPKKLGVKESSIVGLLAAPDDFSRTLGALPDDVVLRKGARGRCDLIIWFVRSTRDLRTRITRVASRDDFQSVWIAWPKQASGVATDVTQSDVRRTGLDAGLVDYKICAIDATWSGLRFARRKRDR